MASGERAHASAISPSSSVPWRQEGGGFEIGLEAEAGAREEEEQGTVEQRKEERLCATTGPPSWAQNKEAWGNRAAHVQSTATRRPRPHAIRARGASHLPLRLSAQPSPGVPWAWGLLSAFWEWGSPDLPACGLRRGSSGSQRGPSSSAQAQRPSRGAKPCWADDRKLPYRQPHQAGSRGGGEIKAGVPREEPVTQAMTIETRRAPGGRRPA